MVRSDRGTVTAELAIALPAVLLLLTFSMQALGLQVGRIELASKAGEMARAAARGEVVSAKQEIRGNLICVKQSKSGLIELVEQQCARRLGL